jgi:serine/threonine-protein kinase
VSPGNILLSREGEVKLTDFGLARSRERWRRSIGGVKGTFEFMAPEQAEGRPADARADVFAVGAVLYAMLAGESPFEAEGPVATLDLVREAKYRPLREAAPTAPDEICEVVARALSRDSEARFVSAAAMGEAIESFAHAQGLRVSADVLAPLVCEVATAPVPMSVPLPMPVPPLRVVATSDSDAPAIAVGRTRAVSPRKSRGRPLIAVGAIVLAGAAVLAFALRPHRSEPAPIAALARQADPAPPPAPAPPVAVPVPVPDPPPAAAPTKPAANPRPAFLTISADPWAFVSIDGKRRGTTPLHDVSLPAGPHEITFENPPLGVSRSQLVRLRAGEHKTVIERLSK